MRPSPIFFGLTAATAASAWWLYSAGLEPPVTGAVFVFVLIGWVLSLTFHEFAHALVAYLGGDRSVVEKGYLTLDPTKYTEPGLSLVMPIIFVVMGGIGLPGGAVWINHGAIRSKMWRSAMSFAGPASNAFFAALCLLPLSFGWVDPFERPGFAIGLAFLGSLQVLAFVLNMVPVPGLDGYGIIEPHLSAKTRAQLRPIAQWGIFALIMALWVIEPVNRRFFDIVDWCVSLFGVEDWLRSEGFREFQFWR